MFRKLVTNLPYSPGLLGQVSFYATRLQREEFTRRLALIFGVLAVVVNINIALFGPQQSVLANPANDIINGGIYGNSAGELQMKTVNAMRTNPSVKAVFDSYGISESDILKTKLETLNTGDPAYRSVGRQAFGRGAEVQKSHNGVTFYERSMYAAYKYRALNVRAIVGYRDSQIGRQDPWFAILESCGNVVIRSGKGEDISITKALHPSQASTVKPGETATYRVKVRSNNNNPAAFPLIRDNLPQYTSYVDHTPKDMFDRVKKTTGNTIELTGSQPLYGIGPGQEIAVDITVRVDSNAPQGSKLCNEVGVVSLSDADISTTRPCVTVYTPPPPPPKPLCVALRIVGGGGTDTKRTYEAEVKANGAAISSYTFDFGDGTSKTVKTTAAKATVEHEYSPGEFKANVKVATSVGTIGGSGSCATAVTVQEETPEPVVTCDYLNLIAGSGSDVNREFEAKASALNGATITEFKFDFGDTAVKTVATDSDNTVRTTHTYKPGTYAAKVTVVSSLGDVIDSNCQVQIKVTEEPKPCPYNPDLTEDDEDCVPPQGESNIILRKKASNITKNIEDAHNTKASAGDVIKYTLITENDGGADKTNYIIEEPLGDVLQYADIIDLSGAKLDEESQTISWPATTIKAGKTVEKTITVKIKSPIPKTAVAVSDQYAFDLKLENTYGNNVTINLPKPAGKRTEEVVTTLPNTGTGSNIAIATVFLGGLTFFYFRNRMISKELRIIKQEFSGGSL